LFDTRHHFVDDFRADQQLEFSVRPTLELYPRLRESRLDSADGVQTRLSFKALKSIDRGLGDARPLGERFLAPPKQGSRSTQA
jgi:hypothetical protein